MEISEDIQIFILLTTLLLLPKILMRFRIPSAITSMALGLFSAIGLGWFHDSQVVYILATLGITSLFLFAGLEVDIAELRKDADVLIKHLGATFVLLVLSTIMAMFALDLSLRPALILALGLTTPSTGFILNSLNSFNFTEEQKYWIRTKAIAKEIVALIILFFALQSDSISTLAISLLSIGVMVAVLPLLFKGFLKLIAPFAKDSEVTFLILLALLCGVLTRKLGTYYLVGAFVVGVVAAQFRHFIKTENSEKMIYSVSFFASLFVPFYFFRAGIGIGNDPFQGMGVVWGLVFFVIFIPLRYFGVVLSMRMNLQKYYADRFEISLSLLPTLIFGLVISFILKERFAVDPSITTGLVIYTVLSSILPAIGLRQAPPEEYDTTLL